jgi:rod shape-determining protein MreD
MRWLGSALALLLALIAQTALGQLAPAQARLLDLFLIVVVYCGLVFGESHGMLVGAAAGWIQDSLAGGSVVGISGLSKVIVGFGVGFAGARFLVGGGAQRLLVVFVASLADALLVERLAGLFELPLGEIGYLDLLARGVVTAAVGAALYELVERRLLREARP